MREKHQSAASCTPLTEDVPATKVHAPGWNQTQDPSVHRQTLHPLSQTGFDKIFIFYGQVVFRSIDVPRLGRVYSEEMALEEV